LEKIKYRCNACKYKFHKFNYPELCPYCSKPAVVEDLENTAEDLLDEVSEN